jgi:hypothetical protein
MLKGLENFQKSFTERYDYKPIPKRLYHPLLLIVDLVIILGLWLVFRSQADFPWLGFAVLFAAGFGYFIVITRTRR